MPSLVKGWERRGSATPRVSSEPLNIDAVVMNFVPVRNLLITLCGKLYFTNP